MPPYATAASLRARYPERDLAQLTDPDGQVVIDATLERACADASAEIDGYLAGRYKLPLVQVPPVLEIMACDIAMYRLQVLRPLADIEDARLRYKNAVHYLGQVSIGRVQLGISEAGVPAPQNTGPELISPDRTFSRDSLRGF